MTTMHMPFFSSDSRQKSRLHLALAVAVAMLLAAIAAHLLAPQRAVAADVPDLETLVPKKIGHWREIPSPFVQAALSPPNREATTRDQPYDAVLMRSYAADGARIMLALAYAGEQRQDIKIHRPEVCYPAQGFVMLAQHPASFPLAKGHADGAQLLVRNRQRLEAVSYWIRTGDEFPRGAWAMRAKILRDGLAGRIDDGILVRVSTLIDNEAQAPSVYAQQQRFLADLVRAVDARMPGLVVPASMG